MNKSLLYIAMLATAAMTLAVSCNTTGCTDNRSSLLLTGFYSMSTEKSISVNGIELGGVDAPDDSLLINADETVSEVYLPFRSINTETEFYIHYTAEGLDDPRLNDTIAFTYQSEPFFASEECGAVYRYHVKRLEYTRHIIDSVALPDSLINNANVERMKIFFRTTDTES